VKASTREADARIASPDLAIRAYLIYGPDRGMAHERADKLAASLLDDPDDPFALTVLTEDDMKADPAILSDSMAALSLTGGTRLVRVRLSGELGNGPVIDVLNGIEAGQFKAEARLIVETGDIKPKGKLRKAFEPAKLALSIACYADTTQSLSQLTDEMLQTHGLTLTNEARSVLLPRLEGDRALARQEIEKLILYKGFDENRVGGDTVDLNDIEAITAGQGDAALDAIIGPVLEGDIVKGDSAYIRALSGGTSPVAVLRALQRRIDQISAVHAGGGNDGAVMRSGAPRFGPQADQFRRQMGIWRGRRLDMARQISFDAERDVKHSGAPANALVGELVLRLARGAANKRS
jgi:DNA polymerase-3 subunit delta